MPFTLNSNYIEVSGTEPSLMDLDALAYDVEIDYVSLVGEVKANAKVTGSSSGATGTVSVHDTVGKKLWIRQTTGTFNFFDQIRVDVSNYVTNPTITTHTQKVFILRVGLPAAETEKGADDTYRSIYKLVGLGIKVLNGASLTCGPEAESVMFDTTGPDRSVEVEANATLNIGFVWQTNDGPGRTAFAGTMFHSAKTNSDGSTAGQEILYVHAGGTLNWDGGIIASSSQQIAIDGEANITTGVFLQHSVENEALFRIQNSVDTVTINGFQTNAQVLIENELADITGLAVESCLEGTCLTIDGVSADGIVTVKNWSTLDKDHDAYLNSGVDNTLVFLNSEDGTQLDIVEGASVTGSAVVKQTVYGTLKDAITNLGVTSAIAYYKDADNGSRISDTLITDPDWPGAADQIVSASPDVDGNYSFTVATKGWTTDGAGTAEGTPLSDHRLHDLSGADVEEVAFLSYDHYPQVLAAAMKGFDGTEINVSLTPDNNVTDTQANADAWTQINDLTRLYDRAKSLNSSATADASFPSAGILAVTAQGSVLNLGGLDLRVRNLGNTAMVFDDVNDRIDIDTDTLSNAGLFNTIKTTGTVTASDGAVIDDKVIIDDSAGIRVPFEITGLAVGAEVRVYVAGTITEIAGVESLTGTTYITSFDSVTYPSVDVSVLSLNYTNIRLTSEPTAGGRSIPVTLVEDRQYELAGE